MSVCISFMTNARVEFMRAKSQVDALKNESKTPKSLQVVALKYAGIGLLIRHNAVT